jgi:hypothetical protein
MQRVFVMVCVCALRCRVKDFKDKFVVIATTLRTVVGKKAALLLQVKALAHDLREEKISSEKMEIGKQQLRKEIDELTRSKQDVRAPRVAVASRWVLRRLPCACACVHGAAR